MQQPDRITPPSFSSIDHIDLKPYSTIYLKNGTPVYYVNTPQTSVLKVDFVYNGGLRNQFSPGQATATNSMLSEGTSQYTSKELAEHLDRYGSYFQAKTNTDDSQVTLYCLPKFLTRCIPYVRAVFTDCTFPETELETYKTNTIQRFLINSQRNAFLGRRAFYASIFGKQNAYGSLVNIEDYQNISRETLTTFYAQNILPGFKYILVSGDVSDAVLQALEDGFGTLPYTPAALIPIFLEAEKPTCLEIENNLSVQSSIRIGKSFVNRNHPDFNKLQLLNLALGGFFGSRLMKNIREEKGLTYGIFSAIESYREGAAFYIETEINNDLRETGKNEIFKEIKQLREKPLSNDELSLIKNYMIGSFLRGIDGPFSLMDRHKMVIDYGFTYQYFQNFVDTIKNTTALELQELANRYFKEDSFTTVIVGKN